MEKFKHFTFLFFAFLSFGFIQTEDPVTWKYAVQSRGEGLYELVIDADIKEPWHVYAMKLKEEGPIPTSFSFEKGEGFELSGPIKELTEPIIKFDPGFRFDVGLYAKKASFRQMVKVTSGKSVSVKLSIEYQSCNDEICLPPTTKEFAIELAGNTTGNISPVADDSANQSAKPATVLPFNVPAFSQSTPDTGSETTEKSSSLSLFFLVAFLAGLAAILTPCVFPMIPMTISFFMRGSEDRGYAVIKGLVFGFSMIFLYTGIGALVSLLGVDAGIGNILSTHWIPNLIFFILFMVFAASFFGLFEIVLPSGLVNRSDQKADKGGLTGAFFMGVTTVLVSFSCTGPIVGSLLIEAAGGEVIKPILGMFFFSLAFALPFTILAIFPSMLNNLPKSGGWLNSVKIVLGFMVLAFGMKFLSNMDQSYHLGIFSREIYIAIWFILSILLGLYLMGKIKFAHDSEVTHIGVPRLILIVATFTFSVYLFTGILGADLNSISGMLPPKTQQNFSLFSGSPEKISSSAAQKNFCGPGKYDDLFEMSNGLNGYFNYEDGINCAQQLQKPVFLDFTGHSCSNCKQMESQVWPEPEVLSKLQNDYVIISLYTDDKTKLPEDEWVTRPDGKVLKTIGDVNRFIQSEKFNSVATPLYVLLDPSGKVLTDPKGKDLDPARFAGFLQEGIDKFNSAN